MNILSTMRTFFPFILRTNRFPNPVRSDRTFFPFLLALFYLQASAQSITPDVVASSGAHFTTGSAQLSWTLGEPLTDTHTGSSNILTQGFHQTELLITALDEASPLLPYINVYPNPTADRVTLHVTRAESDMRAELYDMHGKLLLTERMGRDEQTRQIDLGTLPSAFYILRVTAQGNDRATSFRIQRIAQ